MSAPAPPGMDWAGLMRLGLRGLGLQPRDFWSLTPYELRLMLGVAPGAPLSRARLAELARAFPDSLKGEQDEPISGPARGDDRQP